MGKQIIAKLTKSERDRFAEVNTCRRAVNMVVREAILELEEALRYQDKLWELLKTKYCKELTDPELLRLNIDNATGELILYDEDSFRELKRQSLAARFNLGKLAT